MYNGRISHLEEVLSKELGVEVVYDKIRKVNIPDRDAFVIGKDAAHIICYFDSSWSDDAIVACVKSDYYHASSGMHEAVLEKANLLTDRNYVLENVERCVINTDRNRDFLNTHICWNYLDLSVIYKVVLESSESGKMTFTLSNAMAERLNLTVEDLERASVSNKPAACYVVRTMMDVLLQIAEPADLQELGIPDDSDSGMYIVSSRDGIEGAAAILYPTVFMDLADAVNSDLFINKILSFAIGGNPLPLGGGRSLVNL